MAENIAAKYKWALFFRGLIAILFAVLAFTWPGITIAVLVVLFGIFAIADGIAALVGAVSAAKHHQSWWLLLLVGLLGIAAGLIAFFWPGITVGVLVYVFAIWTVLTGILEIAMAFSKDLHSGEKWLLGTLGIISLIIGVIVMMFPIKSLVVVVWLIGLYAAIFGISTIVLSFQVGNMSKELKEATK